MILELHSPLDMHLHLRDGDMLKLVAPLSSASFAGAVIMPNLVPPVADADAVQAYRQRVLDACGDDVFQPYMTAFFRSYSEKELSRLKELVFGIKLYPAGATTNSEGGVKAMKDTEATLSIMQEMDIPLLVHGESHGFVMDREAEFLDVYRDLATRFPRLTICMEHITTAAAVQLLKGSLALAALLALGASFTPILLHCLLYSLAFSGAGITALASGQKQCGRLCRLYAEGAGLCGSVLVLYFFLVLLSTALLLLTGNGV